MAPNLGGFQIKGRGGGHNNGNRGGGRGRGRGRGRGGRGRGQGRGGGRGRGRGRAGGHHGGQGRGQHHGRDHNHGHNQNHGQNHHEQNEWKTEASESIYYDTGDEEDSQDDSSDSYSPQLEPQHNQEYPATPIVPSVRGQEWQQGAQNGGNTPKVTFSLPPQEVQDRDGDIGMEDVVALPTDNSAQVAAVNEMAAAFMRQWQMTQGNLPPPAQPPSHQNIPGIVLVPTGPAKGKHKKRRRSRRNNADTVTASLQDGGIDNDTIFKVLEAIRVMQEQHHHEGYDGDGEGELPDEAYDPNNYYPQNDPEDDNNPGDAEMGGMGGPSQRTRNKLIIGLRDWVLTQNATMSNIPFKPRLHQLIASVQPHQGMWEVLMNEENLCHSARMWDEQGNEQLAQAFRLMLEQLLLTRSGGQIKPSRAFRDMQQAWTSGNNRRPW